MASNVPNLIFYDTPKGNANLRYFGNFLAPDPFLAMRMRGRSYAVLNALEFARGKRQSRFDEVLDYGELLKETKQPSPTIADVAVLLAKKQRVKTFVVGADFPLGLARRLEAKGLSLKIGENLFPERAIKSTREAEFICQANELNSRCFYEVEKLLRASRPRGGFLVYKDRKLTSELLHARIQAICLEHGASARGTIVAGGDQACDPHEEGFGPLRANELIVVDIFPRGKDGYFGDMTRTYLKGRASEAQQALVDTVLTAQKKAIRALKAGVSGKAVHQLVEKFFDARGFRTSVDKKGYSGFFHGLGHGLGLEVHEAPSLSPRGGVLKEGAVVTVEPGLYYRGIGGCRIEDVVQLTKTGVRMLSSHPYRWQIR